MSVRDERRDGLGEGGSLTVTVIVLAGRVVVAVLDAVYILVVVVLATTRAPQVTAWGYWENEPGLPTGGQTGLFEAARSSTRLPRMAGTEAASTSMNRFLGT